MSVRSCFGMACILLGIVWAGGCSNEIRVYQYPRFYDESLTSVAVTAFGNFTQAPDVGNAMSDKLSKLLRANGTYTIRDRRHCGDLSEESKLNLEKGLPKVTAIFDALRDVQGILVGEVIAYGTARTETRQRPVHEYNPHSGETYIARYVPEEQSVYDATVEVKASLLARDGTVIHRTPGAIKVSKHIESASPQQDAFELLEDAAEEATRCVVREFAVVRRQVKVDLASALRTANDLFDNRWVFTDAFSVEGNRMYVVLSLPSDCEGGRFDIRIVRKGQPEPIISQRIIWNGDQGTHGYVYSPRQIARQGGGSGVYAVELFSGPDRVVTQKFRIE